MIKVFSGIEISEEYGMNIYKNNIKSIKLVSSYPKIISKSNGFTLGYIKKGIFKTNKNTEVKLLINSQKIPLIQIVTKFFTVFIWQLPQQFGSVCYPCY